MQKNIRAFSTSAQVCCRGYSSLLQRAITDFGAEQAFAQVSWKLQEHYGISIPTSSARIITQHHAHEIYERHEKQETINRTGPSHTVILAETDGSMIPMVRPKPMPEDVKSYDARKHKEYFWREGRLSLAHEIGSVTPVFAGTLGHKEEVGKQLRSCVDRVGCNDNTKIHCVGDGAPWIANQVEEQFGTQATYLIDFYHVCEYLAGAALKCGGKEKDAWMEKQRENLKTEHLDEVFKALAPYQELESVKDCDAPVRRCYRYLDNRRNQLGYASALKKGLPIGSGEIESAHRYVIQKRLKIAGAWWKEENAGHMLALRVNRANRNWDNYWRSRKAA